MEGPEEHGRRGRIPSLSFSHQLLLAMIFLILLMAAGITYLDYRQAEATYHSRSQAMQNQTEEDITKSIYIVDAGYEILDNSLNRQMQDGFSLFLQEYEKSGKDPSRMDLDRLKEELGGGMDLYVINESMVIEYTTYAPDLGMDFSEWPYSYNYLKKILTEDGFYPDRVVYEVSSGELRKYAYHPTPDHRYLLELGMTQEAMGERPRVEYQDHLRSIAFNNPSIIGFRAFDTVGRLIGNGTGSQAESPPVLSRVIEERKTLEQRDPVNGTITRYLFVNLADNSYAADTSWIIELVYDQSELDAQLNQLLRFHALVALLSVLVAAGIALVLSRHLTRPVRQIVGDIETIAKGDLDHTLAPSPGTEFTRIGESINELVGTLKGTIERLQQKEAALRNSEAKYRAVVENQTELIVRFLPDGTLLYGNEAYCRFFGIEACDLPHEMRRLELPESDRESLRVHFQSLTADHPSAMIEHRAILPGGEVRWLQWNDRAIFGPEGNIIEFQSVGRDVTRRKEAELNLIESERKYRDLANLLPQVVFEIDRTGRIRYVNKPAFQIFGYEPGEIEQGITLHQILVPEEQEMAFQNFRRALEGHKVEGAEYHLRRKDGSVLPGMVYSSPIEHEGHVVGIRGILVDISHLKKVESDIRQLNEELEMRVAERTRELEAANRELEAFSYSVSHDLRAPLRAIDGFSSILTSEYSKGLDPGMNVLLERIRTNAVRMGHLIDAILNFSRTSRQPLSRQKIFPGQIVQEILEELQPLEKGRTIEVATGPLPACDADPALVRQVFYNLISNALKFTREREIAKVEIGSYRKDQKTVYYVKDNGIGFDMRYSAKLFSVFQRLHDEKEYEGTGIGLAIASRIVQRHGGRIWAEGEVGHGAVFSFTLE